LAALLLAGCSPVTGQAPAIPATQEATQTFLPSELPTATLTALSPNHEVTPTAALPTATPAPPVCMKSSGVIELARLESKLLTRPMEYRVFQPPCYNDDIQRRYPVLFMIHGQSYNADQWDRLGADEAAARLFTSGVLPPFLIVMPTDKAWTEPDDDPFGRVFMEELLPFIDSTYRTLPEAKYRAIGGLSRGAAWAVHLGLKHPDVFGAIGAHSLPVFWSDTYSLRDRLKEIPPEAMPRIYLDDGEKDRWLESAVWFEQLLTNEGVPHEWYLFEGYHEEKYWKAHVEDYLRFYAAEW